MHPSKDSTKCRSRGGSTSNRGAKSGTGRYAGHGSRWGTFTNIRIVNKLLNGESRKMKTLAWRLDAPNLESYHARVGSLYCYCYKCICNVNRGR
ncbi:hypothetical protein HanXRQr2_Chr02g0066771 [Helianthus annuus]|uniref:Uncharacterized protein n=1 Tax=Helianthus annuus TaxID=4232 RepID=A0A9K3JQ16_HELAN|nr:hypothetical protein HanXRQr2_Chr02g0066771 [Helianthus annuus]KAJ0951884.1 hypothetical protein HanPSC8_Chr02g0065621 [Helianthus annuus]